MAIPFTVTVFCGSHSGVRPAYREAAAALGAGIARAGFRLVFGGGHVGLMGTLADAALAEGGTVIGIIPEFLEKAEVAHTGLAELVVTPSMHARKKLMFDLADAFVTLPGGIGTLDETIEVLTWRQLRLHHKPLLLCDVEGSAAPLAALIERMIEEGFTLAEARTYFERLSGVEATLARLAALAARAEAAAD
jgi:uncharacterized protein (TIGR00730 family)